MRVLTVESYLGLYLTHILSTKGHTHGPNIYKYTKSFMSAFLKIGQKRYLAAGVYLWTKYL